VLNNAVGARDWRDFDMSFSVKYGTISVEVKVNLCS